MEPVNEKFNRRTVETALSVIFLLMLIMTTNISTFEGLASGQSGKEPQVWTDRENNIKILFTYFPENPVINTPTELKFSVDNLQTGNHLKNLLATVVIINNSSGQPKIFKFKNITAPNGNFSVEYLPPELGIYQAITRINSAANPSLIALASFKVIVTLETSFSNIIITGIAILVIFGGIAYLVILVKRNQGKKYHLG
jgi:hypothetical protein